jgi:hypothetical protein
VISTRRVDVGVEVDRERQSAAARNAPTALGRDYRDFQSGVAYRNLPRQKCDLCIGTSPAWSWVIEVKLLRFLGDNGQPNDNILMHILSPYPAHRSALTDCNKLIASGMAGRKAIIIYGFESDDWPLEPAIKSFELGIVTK